MVRIRYRPRFFDQVGHLTTYASMGNKHFITDIVRPTKIINRVHTNIGHIIRKQSTLKIKVFKNDFESTNFANFDRVIHNFGRSDDDMIR